MLYCTSTTMKFKKKKAQKKKKRERKKEAQCCKPEAPSQNREFTAENVG